MTAPNTVAAALDRARTLGVDRLDAHMLLEHALGRPRTWLIAHDDAVLDPARWREIEAALARRATGEPLAYILGEKEFHGLMLAVDPNVLIPRPDTEVLVDWALEILGERPSASGEARVVDLGTGSGAIALAVKRARPRAQVLATDASAAALRVAQANAVRHGLDVAFAEGSWWEAIGDRRFDLVLGNPPYIEGGDRHLAALRHEPIEALSPGRDGLASLRAIVLGAAPHLAPGAWILLEHGHDQAAAVSEMLRDAGLDDVQTRRDLAGLARCSGGRR